MPPIDPYDSDPTPARHLTAVPDLPPPAPPEQPTYGGTCETCGRELPGLAELVDHAERCP